MALPFIFIRLTKADGEAKLILGTKFEKFLSVKVSWSNFVKNISLLHKSISLKVLRWAALIALAALLLPLLLLGRYAVPAADDFSYGAPAHLAYAESGSFAAAAAAAAEKTAESYESWQGTFSAIFLMALQPAVFSEGLYALTPWVMLLSLAIGSFIFCRAFLAGLFGLSRELADIACVLLLFLCTQLLPSPVQGFYWYNGAIYYVFFHAVLLVCCALALQLMTRGSVWRVVLLCLGGVILGGGNYVSALTAAILGFFAIALSLLNRDEGYKRLLLPYFLLLAAFALSILAPGNAVRQAAQGDTPGAFEAVLMSFGCGFEYAGAWLSLPLVGALLLLGLLAWPQLKGIGFRFRYPALLSLLSFCVFSAMFCPPVYAMGNVGDKRLLNMVYFAFVLILFVNAVYWLGWWARRRGQVSAAAPSAAAVLLGGLIFIGCCAGAIAGGTGFASLGAVSSLRSGEAAEYHACAQRRFELLKDESVKAAVLEPFPCRPYMLWFDDITQDPADWRNQDMSTYYGKDSVRLAD